MTHQVRRMFLALLCLAASAAAASSACAQTSGQAQPEVQIDASVLNELAPAAGGAARPNLSRPVARPAQPVLTNGQPAQAATYQYQQPAFRQTQQKVVPMPAPGQVQAAPQQDPTKPYAMRRTGSIQPIVPRQPERFPVQQRVRSDSINPAGAGGLTRPAGTTLPPSALTPREVMSAPALPAVHAETAPNGVPTLSRKIPILQPPVVAAPSVPKPVVASKPAPVKSIAEAKPKTVRGDKKTAQKTVMIPVPPRKPASIAVKSARNDVIAPVPARRPENVQTAAEALPDVTAPVVDVTAPLEKAVVAKPVEKKIAATAGLPPTNIPAPPRPGRMPPSVAGALPNAPKVMPAVPTRSVGAEVLPAVPGIAVADASDPLLLQLKDFDRQSFIKQVEGITAGLAPVPARKPQRGGMPPGLNKNNIAVLTPRGDMSKTIPGPSGEALPAETPVAVAVAAAAAAAVDDTAAKLAAIEPAAGGEKFASQKLDRTPRPPPGGENHESAFVTVPFMPGDEKASGDVIKRLEAEVIPLLKANPGWRVQIQAFSSPDNEVRSSARRTALTRALSVREYLMEKGIDAPRMDIRALGMETDRDPLDRIDLVFFDPAKSS